MKKYAHDTLERIRMYCPGTPVVIDNDLDEPFDELLSLSPEEVERA